jgi:hypothetical protein
MKVMIRIKTLIILLAVVGFVGCGQQQVASTKDDANTLLYYAYTPDDTIGNGLYWNLLRIDSLRVEYLMDHPRDNAPEGADSAFASAGLIWKEFLKLCSKNDYEQATRWYLDHEGDFLVAMPTTTMKFYLDYYVIETILMDHLPKEEALAKLIEIYELDKTITETVVAIGQNHSGYIPPHYALLYRTLGETYMYAGLKDKAIEQIEPFRKALYLLSDDEAFNEMEINRLETLISSAFGNATR